MQEKFNQNSVALVDCDAFFCNCERLFRPDLKNVPVGVLSNNDGCFVSRTKELKQLGVKMGAPYFQVKDICKKHNVEVFSSNFSLYTNVSERVMMTLSDFTPELEVYSVDEAFLNLSGIENGNKEAYGRSIKNTVEKNVGIPVSIGIGPTKSIAKIATYIAKKSKKANGVVDLSDRHLQDIAFSQVPVEEIWGIGRKSAPKLHALGIRTVKEFRDFKNDKIIQKIFTKVGLQIKEELAGKTRFSLELAPPKKKEIICSRTFGAPVFSKQEMTEAVANYVSSACEKLRRQDSVCSRVEVFARTSPFKNTPQYYGFEGVNIMSATSDTRKVIVFALSCLDKLYRAGYEYKKVGVKISKITDKDQSQISLFEPPDTPESDTLMKCIDSINARDGDNTLKSAACGVDNRPWSMNRNHKSPRYVTGWSQLRKVK